MKKLTEDDKKLWKYVTKDVVPLGRSSSVPKLSSIVNFSQIVNNYLPQRTKPKQNTYQARIDLHGMTQNEAYSYLTKYIALYKTKGYKCILVVTGKGGKYGRRQTGVLRRAVPLWLEAPKFKHLVKNISPAKREDGGEGAIYVHLN